MTPQDITNFLSTFEARKNRTIIIVDFGNVEKWRESLGWKVGIQELAKLTKHLSSGSQFLRRFYYGADYGPDEKSTILSKWSAKLLDRARMNRFEVVDKRVKYIHDNDNKHGFQKKCDLDVEMAVDLIKERDNYDTIFLFSGDGDLVTALRYLQSEYGKESYVFCARGHLGRELVDAKTEGVILDILYADDFEYRLNMDRHRRG